MRRSLQFLLFTAVNVAIFLSLPLHARHRQLHSRSVAQLQDLHVTDLCLSTEARYTRHPAMADRHAAFQDHPLALEHFPSGSLILPTISARTKP